MSKDSVTVTQAATPEQIAMARKIAADIARSQGYATRANTFLRGVWDNHASVRSALAAIIETTERASAMLRQAAGTETEPAHLCGFDLADSLDRFDHLKGPEQ